MPSSSMVCRHGLVLGVLALATLLVAPIEIARAATAKDNVALKFDVYSGSLRVFKISMGMEIGGGDYAIHTTIKSRGLVSLFAKTKINMSATGKTRRKLTPATYSSSSKSKGKNHSVRMTWNRKGKHKVKRNFSLSPDKSKKLARTVRPGMVDPLSLLMKIVATRPSKRPCAISERVYDGRQVSEYRYSLEGISTFGRDAPGVYRGKAFKCLLKYRSVAGLSAKKQKRQDQGPPAAFNIWFAPVAGTKRKLFVPIAASGKISGRAITVRLRDGTVAGKPLSSRVLATN